ncbi:MAG: DUF2188 domain-containing protein [Calditrichia bacterium]|nr:DUF2188 domain-containing protein [Calditrichia bacterium]
MAARHIFKVIREEQKWLVTKDGKLLGSFSSREKAQSTALDRANQRLSSKVIIYRSNGSVFNSFFNSDYFACRNG